MFTSGTACILPNLPLWLLLELAFLKLTFLMDRLHWGEHSNCLCFLLQLSMGDVRMCPHVSCYILAFLHDVKCLFAWLSIFTNSKYAPLYMGAHICMYGDAHTPIKLDFSVHKITGGSLCCRWMIKVIVILIFKAWDCFSMCAEQIVPAPRCDQVFSPFSANLNYWRRCARLLLTELIYYPLVFLL